MAGPVRLAYRSREAGEGGIDVRARVRPPRPPRPVGSLYPGPRDRATRAAGTPVERGRRSADRRPRVRRCWRSRTARVFPGVAFGAPVAAGGDLVVNTSQTGYQEVCTDPSYAGQVVVMTYPAHRQLRPAGRRRPVDPAVAAGARRGQRDGGRPRRRPPAGRAPARRRDPGHRRRRHARARPPPARERLPARHRDRARARSIRDAAVAAARAVPRWEDQDFVGQVSPSSIMDIGRAEDGGPLIGIVDFGLKSNIVRAMRHRGARVRVLPHTISAVGRPRPGHRRR